ncbi:MAG: NAD(+)/NADH kinase [Clostridia bacterium]|nr:NAD(+)/NADH kinase [Clostridia bacterium]
MKKIGIIANQDRDPGFKYTKTLVESIIQNLGEVLLPKEIAPELNLNIQGYEQDEIINQSEIVVCLGGDGTFLKVARMLYNKEVPILGINLGSLGFLTEVDRNDIPTAAEAIVGGKFGVEERMMLETKIVRTDGSVERDIALNDIVVSRGALSRILHLKTYINHVFIDSFPGDGLIISSPTGSTAYSLSAGGPIVEPDTDLIIVTPICPHILYSRSFVTPGERLVRVVIDEAYGHTAMVTVDGQKGYEVKGGDSIEIKKAASNVKIIRINKRNFFNILRTKIYDRGECLRKNEI